MKKILICIGAIVLGIIPYAFAGSFLINGPPEDNIDTPTTTNVILNSAQSGIIQDINIYIQTSANYSDNLDIALSHGITSVSIYTGLGDTYDSYIDAPFDDEANGSYPGVGTVAGTSFKPLQPLSAFDGLDLSGVWTLSFLDDYIAFDSTDLLSWHIEGTTAGNGTSVPEPTTMLLLGSGLLGLWGLRRKFGK